MKTIFTQLRETFYPSLFLALPAFLLLSPASCAKHGAATKPPDVDYYTCTMHPSVRSQDPNGKCPICSMDLVPVKKQGVAPAPAAAQPSNQAQMENMSGTAAPAGGTNAAEQPSEFTVPVERQQQIGVTYGNIEKRPFTFTIRAVGLVASDKQRRWDYVARVDGYVEKLFVFSRGEMVENDAPLLTIYSPDLLTTENEFLDVLETRDEMLNKGDRVVVESAQHLVDAAKQRLHLWNITEAQIAELEKTRKPQETLTLKSPFKGIVQALGVDQGQRVMVGDPLVQVADLAVVWVWAQFYENELAMLKKGLPVAITTSAYPGETFQGKISVVDPFLSEASRTGRVRLEVDNPGLRLRPEMYVNAELKLDLGEGLAVAGSAVLPTGQHNIVFVDKGAGKLEPRFVDLGRKFGEFYEILAGLKENERVVTSANFLIDAEAKVQGALKSW
ncbi:Efflux transporter, RND family, MFP subunit [Verrucomicrobia bacterium]|nr:Efflux transporter, RND family, MFP subunit [Verrucomicrobiota bacterium]